MRRDGGFSPLSQKAVWHCKAVLLLGTLSAMGFSRAAMPSTDPAPLFTT